MNIEANQETKSVRYMIDKRNISELLHQIEKLNARAARLKVAPINVTPTGEKKTEEIKDEITGFVVAVREFIEIELTGQSPKFAGWTFAATLVHTPEGNIVRTAPGFEGDLSAYRTCPPRCEHCNTTRNRIDTFVLQHDGGSRKQVGRDCIKDFLGHSDPHALARLAELWAACGELAGGALDGDFFGMGGGRVAIYVRTLLAYAAMSIQHRGYVSRKAQEINERLITTRQEVEHLMFPTREELARARAKGEEWPRPTEEHFATADAAREYCGSLEGRNDFENNLIVLSKLETVSGREIGLAVYMVEAYRRHLEGEAKRQAANNSHFGEVGKRFRNVEVEYLGIAGNYETQYGWMVIHKFRVIPTGETIVWKTSGDEDDNSFKLGDHLKMTATVKEHGEFKGWKQTKVSRAKLDEA